MKTLNSIVACTRFSEGQNGGACIPDPLAVVCENLGRLVFLFLVALGTGYGPVSLAAEGAAPAIEQGNRYWEAGDLDKAAESFREAAKVDPLSVTARMKLAGVYLSQHKSREGVRAFQDAIGIDPDNAKAFIGMAIGYMHMGDYTLAQAALREALRIDPSQGEKLQPLLDKIGQRLGREDGLADQAMGSHPGGSMHAAPAGSETKGE